MSWRRFVLLDRDGTLIAERHYLSDPRHVELIEGAASGLRRLREMGCGLLLITNQSAIGRGLIDEDRLTLIHQRLIGLLAAEGVCLDGIYFCPHLPEAECRCRKPMTGLVELAANEMNFDPRNCFVIGDKACDIEMGGRVGATTFLVRTGYGTQTAASGGVVADFVVDDLWEAALTIECMGSACDGTSRGHRYGVFALRDPVAHYPYVGTPAYSGNRHDY